MTYKMTIKISNQIMTLSFSITNYNILLVINPIDITVAILEVRCIVNMIAKAGKASSNVFQSIRANPSIIKQLTIINTGAVMAGTSAITLIIGEKKMEIANKPATTIAVNPVLPPAATPDVDST